MQMANSNEQQQQPRSHLSESSSSSTSSSKSISIIKLDELSSFGATKQSRLPALIKLSTGEQAEEGRLANSMPALSADQLEQKPTPVGQQSSLPAHVQVAGEGAEKDKENLNGPGELSADDFQLVDMLETAELTGPSLPQPRPHSDMADRAQQQQRSALLLSQHFNQQNPSHLGDSLIEMIINLKNENQSLVRALETNNEYVKERLQEFKRANEEAKRREAQFALEKAEHEHQARKLRRQNDVLSERLKSMEAKLKEMKLEVSDSLQAAHSSRASSVRADQGPANLYPNLDEGESFGNSALNQATTIQMDATSGELYNEPAPASPTAPPMETDLSARDQTEPLKVGAMSREELGRRFDADKTEFYAIDDPMKQCDKLEQQLNDIGKRDYEICLLQQQLNIYRQDFRLERMANLEAKIQIEKLKNDIDRLCLERLNDKSNLMKSSNEGEARHHLHRGSRHRASAEGRFDAAGTADAVFSKLGHQLSKKAAKSAAKAAKYAAKQVHREEKAAAAAASAQQAASSRAEFTSDQYGHHRRHHRHCRPGVRAEVVNSLLSTANKAMLTGYKMASTHVNLALDKLNQYEQAQANLAQSHPAASGSAGKASAASMDQPSVD